MESPIEFDDMMICRTQKLVIFQLASPSHTLGDSGRWVRPGEAIGRWCVTRKIAETSTV